MRALTDVCCACEPPLPLGVLCLCTLQIRKATGADCAAQFADRSGRPYTYARGLPLLRGAGEDAKRRPAATRQLAADQAGAAHAARIHRLRTGRPWGGRPSRRECASRARRRL